mmetsp:Transcript_12349/g.30197  ORF Transcript_12349/g.30197 Transcript_12349/m.30197 type:complete len:244 (+) Transcript_12349:150-881(+)
MAGEVRDYGHGSGVGGRGVAFGYADKGFYYDCISGDDECILLALHEAQKAREHAEPRAVQESIGIRIVNITPLLLLRILGCVLSYRGRIRRLERNFHLLHILRVDRAAAQHRGLLPPLVVGAATAALAAATATAAAAAAAAVVAGMDKILLIVEADALTGTRSAAAAARPRRSPLPPTLRRSMEAVDGIVQRARVPGAQGRDLEAREHPLSHPRLGLVQGAMPRGLGWQGGSLRHLDHPRERL